MKNQAIIAKALSDPTRIRILQLLGKSNFCVNALAAQLHITQPAVSQHLRILKQADLVLAKKVGYWVHYALNPATADEFLNEVNKLFHPKGGEKKCRIKPKHANTRTS